MKRLSKFMIIYHHVAAKSRKREVSTLLKSLSIDGAIVHDDKTAGMFDLYVPFGDRQIGRVEDALKKNAITYFFREEIKYTTDDLLAAEYLRIGIDRYPRGETGPTRGTEYELSQACPQCMSGARQASPLRIRSKYLPKTGDVAQTGSEVMVSHRLATELQIDLRSSEGLVQAEEQESREKLPWWQILPVAHMPPVHPDTRGMYATNEQCQECKRDSYSHDADVPIEIVYGLTPAQRKNLKPFMFTHEYFGKSSMEEYKGCPAGYSVPDILVSNAVLRTFLRLKIKHVDFTPVRFM